MKFLIAAILSLLSSVAQGWGSFAGISYQHLLEATALTTDHHWMRWDRLSSLTDSGDNVVHYLQHYHMGKGPAFGQVVEVQKWKPEGNVWGIEVDLLTQGRSPASYYRVGVGVVLGPTGLSSVPESWASHGFLVIPFAGTKAKVDYGLQIAVPCEKACVAIPEDMGLELSPNPAMGQFKCDGQTGICGFWRSGRYLIWGIQQETGQEFKMRQF